MSSGKRKVVIVGAGITGLASALLLADDGFDVTIVARNWLGDESTEWASPWAGALLAPHPDTGFEDLQVASLKYWQHLADHEPSAGVKKIKITECYDDRPGDAKVWYSNVVPNFQMLPSSKLPTGAKIGYTFDGLATNPNQFLPWITQQLRIKGVKFVHATVRSLDQAQKMAGADIVVNASGSGAAALANDRGAVPIRGQTMFIKTPPKFYTQSILRQGSEYTYVIPRASDGGVIMGGFSQADNKSTVPDLSMRTDILRRVNLMTGGMFDWVDLEKDVARDIVGFRPGRKTGLRVEREGNVVHAYGAGGLGYVYGFGVAGRVRELVIGRESRL